MGLVEEVMVLGGVLEMTGNLHRQLSQLRGIEFKKQEGVHHDRKHQD